MEDWQYASSVLTVSSRGVPAAAAAAACDHYNDDCSQRRSARGAGIASAGRVELQDMLSKRAELTDLIAGHTGQKHFYVITDRVGTGVNSVLSVNSPELTLTITITPNPNP